MKKIIFGKNVILVLFIAAILLPLCSKKTDPPELNSVVPGKGLIGDPILIKGNNLENVISVKFNGKTSLILNNTSLEVSTVVPPQATLGINKITVQTDGGQSNEIDFEVVPEPKVTDALPPVLEKLIPASNYIDYPVLIYGKNLSGTISVSFNDVEAEIFTNNQSVITSTVPKGVASGPVKIKIRTLKGTSTINFNVQGPPPNGVVPVNFSIVNIPPPNYVPLISNQWSCGLFSEKGNNTFVDSNSDENFDENFKITGKFEYHFDKGKDYNNLNYVEIINNITHEVLAGQFTSKSDNPCVYRMILISSLTGKISDCTVDVSEFGGNCDN